MIEKNIMEVRYKKYTCPCCGYKTIDSDGDYEVFSWITIPDEIAGELKQIDTNLDMIRYCTLDHKQRDEAQNVVIELLKK